MIIINIKKVSIINFLVHKSGLVIFFKFSTINIQDEGNKKPINCFDDR